MDSSHRKIELQAPGDLTYLTSQLRRAARQKLDLHLPPAPDTTEPDELRSHVEELVETFVAQVLQGMRHNISINGIDVVTRGREGEEVDERGNKILVGGMGDGEEGESLVEKEEFEVFDEKLRGQLAVEVAKRDKLISGISAHRRETAAKAAEEFTRQWESEERVLEERIREMREEESNGGMLMEMGVQRREEVERNWERAVSGLGRLDKGLPETRARLERSGDVVGYLGGGK